MEAGPWESDPRTLESARGQEEEEEEGEAARVWHKAPTASLCYFLLVTSDRARFKGKREPQAGRMLPGPSLESSYPEVKMK